MSRTSFSTDLATPAKALVVVAHPDDAEFQCGATLAKWARAATVVHYIVCTDGSKGTWDPEADQAELVRTRQAEQQAAARVLGATGELVFLGHRDGELLSGPQERSQLAYEIRRLRPTVVLGHDPWRRYRFHPDHRHAGWLTVDAVVAARDPLFMPEHGLAPHRPEALLLFEAGEPNHFETATAADADAKASALLEHRSQFRSTHKITDASDARQLDDFVQQIRKELAQNLVEVASELEANQFETSPAEADQTVGAELFRLMEP